MLRLRLGCFIIIVIDGLFLKIAVLIFLRRRLKPRWGKDASSIFFS